GELGLAAEGSDLTLHAHPVALFEEGRELLHPLPDAGVDLARPVLEQDAEEGFVRAAHARLLTDHEEEAGGRLPDLEVLDPKPVHRSSVARKRRIERETYQKVSAGDNRKGGPIRGRGKPCRGGRGSPGSSRCQRAGRRRRGRPCARIGWRARRPGALGTG